MLQQPTISSLRRLLQEVAVATEMEMYYQAYTTKLDPSAKPTKQGFVTALMDVLLNPEDQAWENSNNA